MLQRQGGIEMEMIWTGFLLAIIGSVGFWRVSEWEKHTSYLNAVLVLMGYVGFLGLMAAGVALGVISFLKMAFK
jgi:predicted histidine transporter YuiF (NhaC family)